MRRFARRPVCGTNLALIGPIHARIGASSCPAAARANLALTWLLGNHTPMAHPHELVVRGAYEALDRDDMAGFAAAFAPDAVLHGGEGVEVAGAESIARMIWRLREMTNGTLRWELHDVLANDDHTVALHITRAERNGRSLADRVVYVFHVRDGQIREAWFSGDPRVQADFYG